MEAFPIELVTFLQWLTKVSLQSSLLICLIISVKMILRERLPARWHCSLWLVLVLRLVVPGGLPTRISIYGLIPALPSTPRATSGILMPRSGGRRSGPEAWTQGSNTPSPSAGDPASLARTEATEPAAMRPLPGLSLPAAGHQQANREPHEITSLIVLVLPWVWLAGAVGLAGHILLKALGLWHTVRCERPVTEQGILDLLEDCKTQMRVHTLVGVVLTDKIGTPALFGFVRPRILIPPGLVETLGRGELRHVFLHELSHLKRRDICLGWLVCLLQVLHWFNPLIWFAFRRMRADQEMAADALVLSTTGAEESRRYGQTVLHLIERFSRPQYIPSLAGILESPSRVEKRIRAIAGFRTDSHRRSSFALILVILLGCVAMTDVRHEKVSGETRPTSSTGRWVNYTSGAQITALVEDGDFLWVGGYGGLTKLNRATGAMIHYNRANSGLPDNSVSSLARDLNGDLWIGTRGGLARFDGTNWTIYRSETAVQPGNGVSCLAIDGNGVKWIGVYGRGLARFDGVSWVFYTKGNSGLPSDDFRSLHIDAKGNKWLGTNGKGLAKFDGSNWTVYDPDNSGIPGVGVYPIAFDPQGNLWVGCQGWNCPNGLARFDGAHWAVYDENNSQLPANCVRSIAIDTDGSKWIGTYKGLARLDGDKWTVYNTDQLRLGATDRYRWPLPDTDVWTILIDTEGVKWFGFYGGLARFDGTAWTVYNTGTSALPDNHITSMAVDARGTKWIATWGGGIARFDHDGWTIYNWLNSDIPGGGDVTRVFAVDHDRAVWLGVHGGDLVRFDGRTWTTYNPGNSGLPGPPRCVAVDAEGHKWIGTPNGLARFDGTAWTVYTSENSALPSNDIGVIAIDREGTKWMAEGLSSPGSTRGPKGLAKFDGTNWTIYSTDNSGLPSNHVLYLAVDTDGNTWIATDRGLTRFDGADWTTYTTAAHWLCPAPDGSIWGLEPSQGTWQVFRVHGDTWSVINLGDSGLPSFLINSFCMDQGGDLWFGTNSGLGCLADLDLGNVAGRQTSGPVHPFTADRLRLPRGKPIELPVPLAQFPRTLDGWTGEDLLTPTTIREYMQANPPDDYLNRRYVNPTAGEWADLSVIYCSSDVLRVFAHQPTDCYPANGWTWDQVDPARIVTHSGRRIDCLAHQFHRMSPARKEIVVLSFYVLNGGLHASERDLADFLPHARNTSRNPGRYLALVQVAAAQRDAARLAACAMADAVFEFLPDSNGVVHAKPGAQD